MARTAVTARTLYFFWNKASFMHHLRKAALAAAAASILASCAGTGSGSIVPRTTAAAAGSKTQDFRYLASPPVKALAGRLQMQSHSLVSQCISIFGLACYTPPALRVAYDVPSSLTGAGQTIVVVDPIGSPTIAADLQTFDAAIGLPDPPSFNVIYPEGPAATPDDGWAAETSLDVEYAHGMAPSASIDLVVAPTAFASSTHAVEEYAIAHRLGRVLTMSFGVPEPFITGGISNKLLQHADALYQQAKAANITVLASTGDLGATNGLDFPPNADFPASDPLVTGVGGTSLFTTVSGAYDHETVWNDSIASLCPFGCLYGLEPAATGGAPSAIFKTPSYQQNLIHGTSRYVGDVSYNAGLYTAVLVYMGFHADPSKNGFYFVGGTSASTPQWAAIVALANQYAGRPLGFINQRLYNIAKGSEYHVAFHDVTVGNNGLFGGAGENAQPGYDMPTGLGSPNVAKLIPALVRAQP